MSVLLVGVHPKLKGGIAAVISNYIGEVKGINTVFTRRFTSKYVDAVLFPLYLVQLVAYLLFMNIHLVHIHGASRGSFVRKYLIFLIAKRLFKKTVFYHIHGGEFHLFYAQSNAFMQRRITHFIETTDLVICLSDEWRNYFNRHFRVKNLKVLPNCVKIPSINIISRSGPVSFLFLGNVVKGKGVFDLLLVASRLKRKRKEFKVMFGGNGDLHLLRAEIANLGIGYDVELLGWVTGEHKSDAMKSCDIFILPSYNEGMPMSILEAMSYGKAIISTNVGGIPEMVKDMETGRLFVPGDLDALETAMNFYIDNPEFIGIHGSVSRKLVETKFSNEVVFDQLNDLYRQF